MVIEKRSDFRYWREFGLKRERRISEFSSYKKYRIFNSSCSDNNYNSQQSNGKNHIRIQMEERKRIERKKKKREKYGAIK